jgi:hypothetical protein
MKTYFPAFVCALCVIGIGIVALSIGLQLVNPLIGMLWLLILAVAMVTVSNSIEGE